MARKKLIVKPRKMWALVDPENPVIEHHRIYEDRVTNAGRGSITEGWVTVRIEIRPV